MYRERQATNILPAICIFSLIGSFTYALILSYKWLAILVASLIFIFTYRYINKKLILIYFIFFLLSIFNNYLYYNISINSTEKVRITKIYNNIAQGELKGRKIFIKGDLRGRECGDIIIAKGKYKEEIDLNRGVIGEFQIQNYDLANKDIITRIYSQRDKIYYKLKENLGSRDSALVTAIAIGDSDRIDLEDKELMKKFGILHVVSVSGLHIVMIYGILQKILGKKISLLVLFLYVIFTGMASATIRAFIMIFLVVMAKMVRRNYNNLAAISLAALILNIVRPYSIFQVGFCLSFLCTISIILFKDKIYNSISFVPKKIRGVISITIASQVIAFPYMIVAFNEYSLNFILGNLILTPIINIILIIGNILILTINFQEIFDFVSFNMHYVIKLLDCLIEFIDKVSIPVLNINLYIAYMYITTIITCWLYKIGYKKIIYMPIVIFLYSSIMVYNPYPRVRYDRAGVLIIGYKGECVGVKVKQEVDVSKFNTIGSNMEFYHDFNNLIINENIKLTKRGKSYILNIRDEQYALEFFNGKKESRYDIINFNNNIFNEFIIINNKIIILD